MTGKIKKTQTLILQIKNGGLGDHMFYSHIPRISKETGSYKYVFISNFQNFATQIIKSLSGRKIHT